MTCNAVAVLKNHGTIAYPTETIFGLGCDPLSNTAIDKINRIKKRSNKAFIIVSNQIKHLQKFTHFDLSQLVIEQRATTYIVPCLKQYQGLLTSNLTTIAIRLSDHPIISKICTEFDSAVVSTSLNLSGEVAIDNYNDAVKQFEKQVDCIVKGNAGKQSPSQIINIETKEVLRR